MGISLQKIHISADGGGGWNGEANATFSSNEGHPVVGKTSACSTTGCPSFEEKVAFACGYGIWRASWQPALTHREG